MAAKKKTGRRSASLIKNRTEVSRQAKGVTGPARTLLDNARSRQKFDTDDIKHLHDLGPVTADDIKKFKKDRGDENKWRSEMRTEFKKSRSAAKKKEGEIVKRGPVLKIRSKSRAKKTTRKKR